MNEEANYRSWLGQKLAERSVRNLKRHDFDAHFFPNSKEALRHILDTVSHYESFGFGGSDTTRSLGVVDALASRGKTIYDHWAEGVFGERNLDIRRHQLRCDCFFCSANAVSATGEVVNVDGIGNRTNGMTFGPRKVVIVAGANKVTPDLDSALRRVREVAAPMRAKSLGMDTPCAETGVCTDCSVPQRICRITTILHRKPMLTDLSVILVNESLGF